VWRFAHHRSDVTYDGDASRVAFWYQPHPNVSQDGRWVLFTSNWEKTLGVDVAPEAGTAARQDVFLVELKPSGVTAPAVSDPLICIDAPGPNAAIAQPFVMSGWAIDRGATTDSGVDTVHVWAYPLNGSQPRFVGVASYGNPRGDLGMVFGSQFSSGGFSLRVAGLPAGTYVLAAFARSRIAGAFNAVGTVAVTLRTQLPRMSIDTPAAGTTTPSFTVSGWAFDPNTDAGTGVDAIHVWAFPSSGAPAFVGLARLGLARADVAAVLGPIGASSGYALSATLPPGSYMLAVFVHSSVTGTFNNSYAVPVTIR
jgi:hypothetical protein